MLLNLSSEYFPGRSPAKAAPARRRVGGTLVTGILLSLGLHGALLLLLLWSVMSGSRTAAPAVAKRLDPVVTVDLLSPDSLTPMAPAKAGITPSSEAVAPLPAAPASTSLVVHRLTHGVGSSPPSQPMALAATATSVSGTAITTARPGPVDPGLAADYRRRLLAHILAYRRPVDALAGQRVDGAATVRFTLERSGNVLSAEVVSSSGMAALDDEAVATIWRARPMPPIPLGLPDTLSIVLPVAPNQTTSR